MKHLVIALFITASCALPANAQLRDLQRERASLPPVAEIEPQRAAGGSHPIVRTIAAVGGSAAAFAIAQSRTGDEPDDIIIPMAAAVAGGALGTMFFSNAHPLRIIMGSALSALPGAALAMYLVGVTEDEEQEDYLPLISFSIPHGLLSSAFGQNR
jgi:hypothetical protein